MKALASQSSISSAATSGGIALGLGLTNECNLSCSFCYRDPARTDRLTLDQVKSVLERLPVRSVNLGTGENGMHPEFRAILAYLRTQPVKLTITSNGHSIAVLEDSELRAFHDIEFSLDYPTQVEQDMQRGLGNWTLIQQQAARSVKLGVPVTIIAVMMKSNYLRLAEIARVARQFDAPLRVNVYQAVRSDVYAQLLRARMIGEAYGVAEIDESAAAYEAEQAASFQLPSGGFLFGRKNGVPMSFVNPVSTAFCAQALAWWEGRLTKFSPKGGVI